MINITDAQGNSIAWSSAGSQGFKGSRKSTPYAAQMAAEDAGRKAQDHGVKTLEVEVKARGRGGVRVTRFTSCRLHDYGDPRCVADPITAVAPENGAAFNAEYSPGPQGRHKTKNSSAALAAVRTMV